VVGIGRHHHLDPADVRKDRLRALRVSLPAPDATATGRTNSDRRGKLTCRTVSQPGKLTDDLVEPRVDVVSELNLRDGLQPVHAHPDRRPNDSTLRNRRVQHTMFAVLTLQAVSHPEHTAEVANIFAEDHYPRIALQHDIHGGVEGLDHVHVRHRVSPLSPRTESARPGSAVPE